MTFPSLESFRRFSGHCPGSIERGERDLASKGAALCHRANGHPPAPLTGSAAASCRGSRRSQNRCNPAFVLNFHDQTGSCMHCTAMLAAMLSRELSSFLWALSHALLSLSVKKRQQTKIRINASLFLSSTSMTRLAAAWMYPRIQTTCAAL